MNISFGENLCKGKVTYGRLAKLQNKIISSRDTDIELHLTSSGRVGKTFIFLMGTLTYLAEQHGKKLHGVLPDKIYNKFIELDIVSHSNKQDKRFQIINSVEESKDIITAIVREIPVKMSRKLSEDIVSRIGELYNNAFEHSSASFVLGGRYFKQGKKYCFTCYDTGIGICKKVQQYNPNLSDEAALKWAMRRFNSTVKSDVPRGLGLALLKEFAKLNKGTLKVCTGKVLYTYSDIEEKYETLTNSFQGTLFEMDINANGSAYHYRGEKE